MTEETAVSTSPPCLSIAPSLPAIVPVCLSIPTPPPRAPMHAKAAAFPIRAGPGRAGPGRGGSWPPFPLGWGGGKEAERLGALVCFTSNASKTGVLAAAPSRIRVLLVPFTSNTRLAAALLQQPLLVLLLHCWHRPESACC